MGYFYDIKLTKLLYLALSAILIVPFYFGCRYSVVDATGFGNENDRDLDIDKENLLFWIEQKVIILLVGVGVFLVAAR